MTFPTASIDRVLRIYSALTQSPILRIRTHSRMRREPFKHYVLTPQQFETEVHDRAIESQVREGVHNPFQEEPGEVWETRLERIRSHLTDFYFAYDLPYDVFEQITRDVLLERGAQTDDFLVTFNPDTLLYRRSKGLQDYDEQMVILIQFVKVQQFGNCYLPHAAGVAFSQNSFRWSPEIRQEDEFVRLVWGIGIRAVERVGNNYPKLVALSHPLLHPEVSPKAIRRVLLSDSWMLSIYRVILTKPCSSLRSLIYITLCCVI